MKKNVLTSSYLDLRDKLHRIALSYLQDDEDAKDALQDTWLRLNNKGMIENPAEARNKLVAVLRNVCIDRLRKAKHLPINPSIAICNQYCRIDEEDLGQLEELLQKELTSLQKTIFNLVVHEGLGYDDIAKKLSLSVSAVRMNMCRTRKKMRETYRQLNK